MADSDLIEAAAEFIEAKVLQVKRKFEVLYSSSREVEKKEAAFKTLDGIEKDLKKLRSGHMTFEDLSKYELTEQELKLYVDNRNKPGESEYKILRNVIYDRLHIFCDNEEINWVWTYLNYFGKEYLGLLSEQNLKLDYGHAYQRDKFFTLFNQTIRVLDEYGNILHQIEAAEANNNKAFLERLEKVETKEYRNVIVKTGRFLHTIQLFIEDIVESEKKGEKVLLEPDKVVSIEGEHSSLDGLTTRRALMDLYQFVREFIAFMKIPDLEHISEDEEKK
jgi:hypothetical protein